MKIYLSGIALLLMMSCSTTKMLPGGIRQLSDRQLTREVRRSIRASLSKEDLRFLSDHPLQVIYDTVAVKK